MEGSHVMSARDLVRWGRVAGAVLRLGGRRRLALAVSLVLAVVVALGLTDTGARAGSLRDSIADVGSRAVATGGLWRL